MLFPPALKMTLLDQHPWFAGAEAIVTVTGAG